MEIGYLIFARKEYQKPLECLGRLALREGQNDELGRFARERFGAAEWIEMIAIPETAVLRVIPMDQPPVSNL